MKNVNKVLRVLQAAVIGSGKHSPIWLNNEIWWDTEIDMIKNGVGNATLSLYILVIGRNAVEWVFQPRTTPKQYNKSYFKHA